MKQLMIFTFIAGSALAGDYGLVKTHIKPPVVINRMVSLSPLQTPRADDTLDPINIAAQGVRNNSLPGPQWRQFRFADNTGEYIPQPQPVRQASRSVAVTKTYVGVVDLSYKIQPDGSVVFIKAGDHNESTNSANNGYTSQAGR